MSRFSAVGSLLVLTLVLTTVIELVPGRADAQATSAPTDAQRARARQLYGEGQAHFDAGRFEQAQAAFQGAYDQVPNPVVLLGVASAQERLGNSADAARTLRLYLRERPDAPDRATITERIAQLDPTGATAEPATAATGTIRVVCTPAGAAITIDGQDTGRTAPADLEVAPGEHTVTLTLEGHQPVTETVMVAPGGMNELALTLAAVEEGVPLEGTEADALGETGEGDAEAEADAMTSPPPLTAADTSPSTGVWVTTAIAGVGLVTGTVFGFLALSAQSDFDSNPTADAADRGETFALVADLAFGVAIAAGVTAIVLYATDRPAAEAEGDVDAEPTARRDQAPRLTLAPWGGPSGGGAAMRLQF